MTQRMRIGFSGKAGGEVKRALAAVAQLSDYDDGSPPDRFDAIVIEAGGRRDVADPARIEALLAAGLSVGWVDPSGPALDAIAAAFGMRFEPDKGLLMLARTLRDGAKWRRVERARGFPPTRVNVALASESGEVNIHPAKLRTPSPKAVAKLIAAAAVRDWTATLPQTASGLIPPTGAVFSATQYTNNCTGSLPASGWSTGGGAQTVSWSYNGWSYQYYVNGNGGNSYNMILVTDFTSSPGTLASNSGSSRVWFQALTEPGVQLTTTGTNSIANIVHSPPTVGVGGPAVDSVSVPMSFQVQGSPVAWNASYSNSYPTPDWGVNDNSNVGTGVTQWLFYENSVWNPTQNPPTDFANWWNNVFDSNDNVDVLPTSSTQAYNLEVASGWSVTGNPNNAGPLNVTLQFSIASGFYGFANASGTGNGHHQIVFLVDANNNPILWGPAWPITIDLVATT